MKKTTTLKKNYEFRRVYHTGKSGVSPLLVVYARPNRSGRNRLGVTAGAKLGNAVARNRAKRRLRELFRLSQPQMKRGWDVILVARARAVTAPYRELSRAYRKLCDKLALWEEKG